MKIGQQIKFIVVNKQANSLYSLVADGQRRLTSLGRDTWISLMGSYGYLYSNCRREGFNTLSDDTSMGKARIGIIGNNENDCVTCDTRIGFGTGGRHNDASTCGSQDRTSIGYILVQWDETGDRNVTIIVTVIGRSLSTPVHESLWQPLKYIFTCSFEKRGLLIVRNLFKPVWLDLVLTILLTISIWLWFNLYSMKLRVVDQKHAKLLKLNLVNWLMM